MNLGSLGSLDTPSVTTYECPLWLVSKVHYDHLYPYSLLVLGTLNSYSLAHILVAIDRLYP